MAKRKNLSHKRVTTMQPHSKDTVTKQLFKNNENFASVFNCLLGCNIDPNKLVECDTTETATIESSNGQHIALYQDMRDVSKYYLSDTGKAILSILCIENQTAIDYAMPNRIMQYNAFSNGNNINQIKAKNEAEWKKSSHKNVTNDEFLCRFKKSDRIPPVITVVIYYGKKEWDGPTSLKEMYSPAPKKLENLVADYNIHHNCGRIPRPL